MRIKELTAIILLAVFGELNTGKNHSSGNMEPVNWSFDNLASIGGATVTVLGNPRVIDSPNLKALHFDGHSDGIVIDANPINGAEAFTIEAIFQPEAGGEKEQRWLHIEAATDEDRALLEIRLDGNQWFLDTFLKGGESRLPLYAENFKHPVGPWYHVALVYDGKEMRHYVNGRLELAGALTIKPLKGGKTSVGVRMNRVYWFKGSVRKARFTKRVLDPKEFMPL